MNKETYNKLAEALSHRGPGKSGIKEIPELYELLEELFTVEEAQIAAAQPLTATAKTIADIMGKNESEVTTILEIMAEKGLCWSFDRDGIRYYTAPILEIIRDMQFNRGTFTDRDKKLAKLFDNYKVARKVHYDYINTPLPVFRIIPIEESVESKTKVHTYDQLSHYIENSDPIAVASCFCRHQARLLDPEDICAAPIQGCMCFNDSAAFSIERKFGRKIEKDEAFDILKKSEELGLVHLSLNRQDIPWICNCCTCHCINLINHLIAPKPALSVHSSFRSKISPELCVLCKTCITRCPGNARSLKDDSFIEIDPDRCIGCGLCASGCPEKAVIMENRPDEKQPPVDEAAFMSEWIKAAQ